MLIVVDIFRMIIVVAGSFNNQVSVDFSVPEFILCIGLLFIWLFSFFITLNFVYVFQLIASLITHSSSSHHTRHTVNCAIRYFTTQQ